MAHPTLTTLTLTGLTCSALLLSGCSESSRSSDAQLSTGTGAITSSQVIGAASAGMLPGIPGLSQLADLARLDGPEVEITSPARSAVMPAGTVQVSAKITDRGRGIAEVHVQGISTPVASDGTVTATVQLTSGMNTIVVEAWDNNQRRTERHRSVLAGDFLPEAQALASTSSLRLTDDALDALEPTMDQAIEAQRAALIQQVMQTNMGKDTKVNGFRYGTAKAQIDAVPGGIAFQVDVPNVELDFQVTVKILFFFKKTKRGTIRAQNLQVRGMVNLGLDANGQLTSSVTNVNGYVTGFTVPDFARDYRTKIQNAFTQGFADQTSKEVDKTVGQVITATPTAGNVTQTILGQGIRTDWTLSGLTFDDWGVTTVFGGNVAAVTPNAGSLQESLVVNTPVADLIGAGPGWNGAVALHQNSINRTLHAAWRAGALKMDLNAATFQQLGAAAPNSSNLISMAPGLASLIPANLPMEMKVEGTLPPVVRVRPNAPHQLDVSLGGLKVSSIINDPQGGPISVGESVYAVDAEVSLAVQNGQLKLVPTGQVKVRVDLVGQALPGTEALLTQVADSMATPLIKAALANTAGLPVPAFNGYSLQGTQFMAHQESIVGAGTIVPVPAAPGSGTP